MFWDALASKLRLKIKYPSVDELLSNRKKFEDFVYTNSLTDAVDILKKRRGDSNLEKKVIKFLGEAGLPSPFLHAMRLVMFRQVATPNIEISRFLIAADGVDVKPVFFEYLEDKFTSNNEWKRYLGKIAFYDGVGKKGGDKINYHTIIDFNRSNGKKISEVVTSWGDKLADFHRSLFPLNYSHVNDDFFFEGSDWFKKGGGKACVYYPKFLSLLICHGILFENFLLDREDEFLFCKEIFLPALLEVRKKFGLKPLIIPLSPTSIETAEFWLCHNPRTRKWFEETMLK